MTRKHNESFIEFKKRALDSVSPSFCTSKWYNATIWLGHGQTTSCHHPPAHRIDVTELETNPSAIHNTKHKKLMRKYMQEGTRPQECEYCWRIEDNAPNAISDRVYKSEIYSDDDNQAASTMPWDTDVTLKTLEISFERTCNFACSYCNPAFSTTWVNDIKKFGPYRNIISDARGHFSDTAPWAAGFKNEDENPYIKAFWNWWNSGLSDSLEEIRITGGEPLMAPSVWKLFDWFKENGTKNKNLRFAVNSNLVPKKNETIDKLIEASKYVSHLEIYTSNESYGAQSEYIRDGMIWDKWISNIHRLINEGNIHSLHVMMTINGLCLDSITDFMDEMLNIKRQYGAQYPTMTLNLLRFPSFQSPAILPNAIKLHYKEKLEKWFNNILRSNEKDKNGLFLLTDMEQEHIKRLVDYLDAVKTPHKDTAEPEKLFNDFRNFYEQYDVRRNKDFRKTFPGILSDFINSVKVPVPSHLEILNNKYRDELNIINGSTGDPATTDNYDNLD